jgi:hypothetical protein
MLSIRDKVASAIAVVVILVAIGNVITGYAPAVRRAHRALSDQEAIAASDRALASAYSYDVSRAYIVAARRLLPPTADYVFVIGPNASESHAFTLMGAPFVSRYLLMPRKEVPAGQAQWLLCYGCPDPTAAHHAEIVWREADATGLVISRFRR